MTVRSRTPLRIETSVHRSASPRSIVPTTVRRAEVIVNFLREPRPGSTVNDRGLLGEAFANGPIVLRRARARLSKEVDDHFGSPDGGRNDRTRRCRTVDACFYPERWAENGARKRVLGAWSARASFRRLKYSVIANFGVEKGSSESNVPSGTSNSELPVQNFDIPTKTMEFL